MNEDRDTVRKCLVFLLEMLTRIKMFIVLVRNIISFLPKESQCSTAEPSPAKIVNSELAEFDLFHLNRLL